MLNDQKKAEADTAVWVNGVFPTAENSPFMDRYDITSEKMALADIFEGGEDVSETDERYGRFMMLVERMELLDRMAANEQQRSHADSAVSDKVARGMVSIGSLQASETETVALQTREAYRMLIGRKPENNRHGLPSGIRAAGAVREVLQLSYSENPYADVALIQFEQRIEVVRQRIKNAINDFEAKKNEDRKRGLNYNWLISASVGHVSIGFKSAYGYMISDMLLDYDEFVRKIKTLESRGRLTSDEADKIKHMIGTAVRSVFHYIMSARRMLQMQQLKGLTRKNFLPGASEEQVKQIIAANTLLGKIPREVLTGQIIPSIHRGQHRFNEKELKLLEVAELDPKIVGLDVDAIKLAQKES